MAMAEAQLPVLILEQVAAAVALVRPAEEQVVLMLAEAVPVDQMYIELVQALLMLEAVVADMIVSLVLPLVVVLVVVVQVVNTQHQVRPVLLIQVAEEVEPTLALAGPEELV